MNFSNPLELINFIKNNSNPQQFMLNMLEERAGNNPMMQNLLQLAKQGKTKDIQQVARNTFKEQGRDFDKEFSDFKKTLGL